MKKFGMTCLILCVALIFVGCTESYGNKHKEGNLEIFYLDPATPEHAQKLATLFDEINLISEKDQSVQIQKENDAWVLKMVLNNPENPEKIDGIVKAELQRLREIVSDSIFDGDKVVIELTDQHFRSLINIGD